MHNKHMGDSISTVTHTQDKVPGGAVIDAESAWNAAKDISEGDLYGAATHFQTGKDNPQGLVVGQIGDGVGAGVRSSWEHKLHEIQIESEVIAGASMGFDGPDASVRAQVTAEKDLGGGHSWNARGFGEYSLQDGLDVGLAAERNYENPSSDLDLQSWSVAAGTGTLGSEICAAGRAEVTYGNDVTRAFARGAAGVCEDSGARYSLEGGVQHEVGQYSKFLPNGTVIEGGIRVGDGGQVDLTRERSFGNNDGPTAFVGVKIGF